MAIDKRTARARRARKTRARIARLGRPRLCVHRTPRHIYAQLIAPEGGKVLAVSSTLHMRGELKNTGNIAAATAVGKRLGEQALKAGVDSVAFDRSGFRFHGRIKALADAAREAGLKF